MTSVRAAVIGYGISGPELHIPILNRHPDVELVGICDTDPRKLEAAASEFPSVSRYADYTTMYQMEKPDSVHVCIPPQFRLELVEYFAPRGVSMLLEKPCATSCEDIRQMQELTNAHDTVLSVVHNRLFTPQFREALDRVDNGAIGDVVSVSMIYSEDRDLTTTRRGDWVFDLPGAELGEGLVHQVYLPLAFVEGLGNIESITFDNHAKYDQQVRFDGVNIRSKDQTGTRSVNISITMSSINGSLLHVFGTEGELIVPQNLLGSYVRRGGDVITNTLGFVWRALSSLGTQLIDAGVRRIYSALGDSRSMRNMGHYVQIDRHLRSIRRGERPPVTLDEAHDCVRVLEAIEHADGGG